MTPRSARFAVVLMALLLTWSIAPPATAHPMHPVEPGGGADCNTENLLAGRVPAEQTAVRGHIAAVTDETTAAEGTPWDAPLAVVLENSASTITYDLGKTRSVSALYLQADANDTYVIQGSTDGAPGSYLFLSQIDVVAEQGHGLRGRSVEIPHTFVRYLRVGSISGDGAFSISEFAAYCHPPTPFPPKMRQASAVAAAPPPSAPVSKEESPRSTDSGRTALLVVAAALALLGVVASLGSTKSRKPKPHRSRPDRTRPRRARKERGRKRLAESGGTAAEPVTAAAAREPVPADPTHHRTLAMFVASGCAALIYEVVWLHLLRLVIGASALSVGIVLAAFMGGMFLGSLYFSRFVPPGRDPLRIYGYLELGIGIFGLVMPLLLPAVRQVYVGLVGYGTLGIALRAVIAAGMLLPPTALMGATLPAIARRYSHGREGMSKLAALYAANTIGAVLGSLLSAFYLLAVWDVWVATFVAVALNLAIGGVAIRISHPGLFKPAHRAEAAASDPDESLPPRRQWMPAVYLSIGLSGMTSLGAQVVWTRLLTLLFGATVYAFAIILAVFLGGLGIGSALAAYLLRRGADPIRTLAWTQLGLMPALALSGLLLAGVLPYASPIAGAPIGALHALHVLRAIDIILPAAILWGMSFPLALAAAGWGKVDTGKSSGYVYAANTIGAIVGSLGTSFVMIPLWGTHWAQRGLVIGAAISAAALFYVIYSAPKKSPWAVARPEWFSPLWALAVGAAAAGLLPGLSHVFLAHGRYIWWVDPKDQYPYVSEGASSTVAVHIAPDGYRNFHVSGRVEASTNPNDMRLQRLLGHLSALAHPRPQSALVVGLGAGVTAGALSLHPELRRIVICEIEPRVAGAARQFAHENYQVLDDPRVEMVFDDARHFLATTREKFDVITSDPIHPWVRGNSILFSREYYSIVRGRLNPGGIATQWVPLYETSELAIKIQMHTFMTAFPEGTVYNSQPTARGYDVVLLGRVEPLQLDLAEIQRRIDASPHIAQSLAEVRIRDAVELLATYATRGADMQRWLQGTPLNRDFSLKLEYISGLALNKGEADPIYAHMVADRVYPEDLFVGAPAKEAELRRRLAHVEVAPPQ